MLRPTCTQYDNIVKQIIVNLLCCFKSDHVLFNQKVLSIPAV